MMLKLQKKTGKYKAEAQYADHYRAKTAARHEKSGK